MERPSVALVKKNWRFIDEHVQKIRDHDERSYANLIAFFDKPIKTKLDRNIYMTRAIIYWMFRFGDRQEWTGIGSEDSPLKLMKSIKDRKISRQDAFKSLCNAADIPCECVSGISKLAKFEPGQRDVSDFRTIWNKVQLEGSWWPVYPDWIIMTAKGSGSAVQQFTEFWFLTDPEIFIYKCYPDNIEDQMLPASKQVKDVRKFAKMPLLSYHFFKHNLKLTSENSSVLDADNGKCVVSFKTDSAFAKTLNFYTVLKIPDSSKKRFDPDRLVFNSRRKGQFFFEVRCPVLGIYDLEIRGGPIGGDVKKYVTAKIECLDGEDNVTELPINAGETGWGFGPAAEKVGLNKPTIKDPKIVVHLRRKTVLGFTLDNQKAKSQQFEAKLYHNNSLAAQDKGSVEIDKTHDNLTVKINLRSAGEYALSIYASSDDRRGTTPVCNYLLSTLEDAEAVAEEYEDSSDGFSDIDEENYILEREVTELEEQYHELLRKAELSAATKR